jgi:uncharacterized protein YbaR (Trm112 family)
LILTERIPAKLTFEWIDVAISCSNAIALPALQPNTSRYAPLDTKMYILSAHFTSFLGCETPSFANKKVVFGTKNPFSYGTIAMRDDFAGRADEISRIEHTIRLGESIAVVAPNGMGKSSLLAELARRFAPEFIFVPIDLSGITNELALLEVMTRESMKAAYGAIEFYPPEAWELLENPRLRKTVIEGIRYGSVKRLGTRFIEFSAQKMVDRMAAPTPAKSRMEIRMCPSCGAPLKWVEKYSRHYCYHCKKYVPVRRNIKRPLRSLQESPLEELACPRCKGELKFVHRYSEYYCEICDRYPMMEVRKGNNDTLTSDDGQEALDLPERIANRKVTRVVVMMDEFQEVATFENPAFLADMRKRFDMHGNVSYIFSGINNQFMHETFQRKGGPFADFAYWLDLAPIPAPLLQEFLMKKFDSAKGRLSAEAAGMIVGMSGGFPDYAQKIAHELWQTSTSPSLAQTESVVDSFVRHRSPMYSVLWESIRSPIHRRFLLAMANEPKVPHGDEFVKRHKLKSRSHVQRASKQLEMRGIVKDDEIVDPMFVLWLRSATYA